MTVAITRLDISVSELREAAAGTQDAKAARRMLAIALVLDGWPRDAAAEACAMDRQTLRDLTAFGSTAQLPDDLIGSKAVTLSIAIIDLVD